MATKKKARRNRVARTPKEILIRRDGSVSPAVISLSQDGGLRWRSVDPRQKWAINFGPFDEGSILNDQGGGKTNDLLLRADIKVNDQFAYRVLGPLPLTRRRLKIFSGGGIIVDA